MGQEEDAEHERQILQNEGLPAVRMWRVRHAWRQGNKGIVIAAIAFAALMYIALLAAAVGLGFGGFRLFNKMHHATTDGTPSTVLT